MQRYEKNLNYANKILKNIGKYASYIKFQSLIIFNVKNLKLSIVNMRAFESVIIYIFYYKYRDFNFKNQQITFYFSFVLHKIEFVLTD